MTHIVSGSPSRADVDNSVALAPRLDDPDWASAADALISVVTNRPHSDVSSRGYRSALRQFLAWHLSQTQTQGGGPLTRQLVQRYCVVLEGRNLAPSTINQHLSAIRALADECAESGLLNQPTAAAIGRVKGVPIRGVRLGKSLTRYQACTYWANFAVAEQPARGTAPIDCCTVFAS